MPLVAHCIGSNGVKGWYSFLLIVEMVGEGMCNDQQALLVGSDLYVVVSVKAFSRIDCGGSTDHRLTALICRRWNPATTNIALNLHTTVNLKPYLPKRILDESK